MPSAVPAIIDLLNQESSAEPRTPEAIELDKRMLKIAKQLYKNKNKETQPTIT
jgi:hypothetical protein